MDRIAEILSTAAERAAAAPSVPKAIQAGWSGCHADRDLIGPVFARWCRSEDYAGHVPDFGGVLQRRYRKAGPAAIAESLRRAAGIGPQS